MTGKPTILAAAAAILLGMAGMASVAEARGVVAGGPHAGTSRGGVAPTHCSSGGPREAAIGGSATTPVSNATGNARCLASALRNVAADGSVSVGAPAEGR